VRRVVALHLGTLDTPLMERVTMSLTLAAREVLIHAAHRSRRDFVAEFQRVADSMERSVQTRRRSASPSAVPLCRSPGEEQLAPIAAAVSGSRFARRSLSALELGDVPAKNIDLPIVEGGHLVALRPRAVHHLALMRVRATNEQLAFVPLRIGVGSGFLQDLDRLLNSSQEQFLDHFYDKYDHANPPIWIGSEVLTLGGIKYVYDGSPVAVRTKIAGHFGLPHPAFQSWLFTLNTARNVCAHHGRFLEPRDRKPADQALRVVASAR